MSKQSCIYVIAFDSGTLKVGRTADAVGRLAVHHREASRHGIAITSQWRSKSCSEREAVYYEQQLIAFCAGRGTRRAGTEYFGDLKFLEIKSFAEALVETPVPPAATKQGAPATSKVALPIGYHPPFWKDGVLYVHEDDDFPGELVPAPSPPTPRTPEQLERLRRTMVDEKYEF